MLRNESKLTKYTLLGCTLLLIAYFAASAARADEDEASTSGFTACAAVNGMLGQFVEDGELAATYQADARFWSEVLVRWVGREEAKARVLIDMTQIQNAYNNQRLTIEQMMMLSVSCAKMQPDVERILREESE